MKYFFFQFIFVSYQQTDPFSQDHKIEFHGNHKNPQEETEGRVGCK